MPKFKDFFSKLKDQGKINSPEFDEYLKTVPDAEIPDIVVKAIEDNFMTRERALADKHIKGTIFQQALFPVEKEIDAIASLLDPVDSRITTDLQWMQRDIYDPTKPDKYTKGPDTYGKLEKLRSSLPSIFDKLKKTPVMDDEVKNKLKEYEDYKLQTTEKFSKAEKDYQDRLLAEQKKFDSQLHDFKLNVELQNLGNKYTLAEAFEETRPAITEVIMSKIKSSNNLKLAEKDGKPFVQVYDDKGQPRFNGNSAITITELLDESYKPFLKKSESSVRDNPKTTTEVNNQNPAIRRGAPTTVVQHVK